MDLDIFLPENPKSEPDRPEAGRGVDMWFCQYLGIAVRFVPGLGLSATATAAISCLICQAIISTQALNTADPTKTRASTCCQR